MAWTQKLLKLSPKSRGAHLITKEILDTLPELEDINVGLLNIFIRHTSASLTINENADPDVPRDLAMAMEKIVREDYPYTHTVEGPDDMPAHVKSSLTASSLVIPISEGHLALGTWHGIFLLEHRNRGGIRELVLTIQA